MWQENHDLVTISETWWDHSNDWSAAMDGYKLFRRDRKLRRGGGVALHIRECFDAVELRVGNEKVESLQIRIGGWPTRRTSWWGSVIDSNHDDSAG